MLKTNAVNKKKKKRNSMFIHVIIIIYGGMFGIRVESMCIL